MSGRLIGVGTGPGDPELLTLKAARLLGEADVLAYFAKAGQPSNARAIVVAHLRAGMIEEQLSYPLTTEIPRRSASYRAQIAAFFSEATARLAAHLDAGRTVAVLSEGDPLFYGSYMHVHVRLASLYPSEIVPGISAMSGAWSLAGLPLVQGDDVLTVVPATLACAELARRLGDCQGAVIMKLGRNLAKVREALRLAGRLDQALYVERGTMAGGYCLALADKPDDAAPYFSLILVPGWSARPG